MDNHRHKVALVDDNEATLDQGKSLLQAHYRVMTFQSAALLFEYLENDLPDLILLDVEMPGMDGFETIEILKANPRYMDIPVIFLTAKNDEESERKGFRLGAVDYIAKPFSAPLLQKRISNQILYMRVQNAVKDYSDNLEAMVDEVTKANERTKLLLDKMPFSCRLIDKNYNMLDCNEAAVKLFGFKDKQECKERFKDLHPEYQPNGKRSIDYLKTLVEKSFNEGVFEFEWTYKLLDGTLMPAEVTFVPIEHEGSQALAVYTRDLREHEAVAVEKRRSEIAEMTSLAKSQFLAMMSHELRTPMNSITGFIEQIPFDVRDVILRCQSVKSVPNKKIDPDDDLRERLKVNFVKNNQTTYEDIMEALSKDDMKTAHRLAHTLKGNAAQIGKTALQQAAEDAERLLKEGKTPDKKIRELLKNELTLVLNELKPLLDERKDTLPPLSAEQVKELFETLEPMLKQNNTECVDLLDKVRAVPGADELARQIEQYDFKLAEQTLAKLKAEQGI